MRMGLHTGEPAVGEEGYHGLDVVRAARLGGVGGGGHVVLSETTRALLGSAVPEGVSVHPLGERRLKDLDEPERVYELDIDGVVRTDAPAPAEADAEQDDIFEERVQDLGKRMSERIQEQVYRSLEQSLGTIGRPRD